jgi:hypothetical protein
MFLKGSEVKMLGTGTTVTNTNLMHEEFKSSEIREMPATIHSRNFFLQRGY